MNRDELATRTRIPAAFAAALALCITACQESEPPVKEKPEPQFGMAPVNGTELHYEIHGAGEPLVLLHGGLGHSGHFKNQVPDLSDSYRVITVDSRGHGRSAPSERPISYELMASDVIALMDYLDVKKAHVLGWSDGGIIGLYMAVNHPKRLVKVVASGANYDPSGIRPDVGEHPKFVSYFELAMADYQALSPDPSNWEALMGSVAGMWATEPDFTADELGSIAVPVLLLEGENEEAIFPEHTSEMAGMIPTARLEIIRGTGHFGLWEKPAEFNDAVLRFLAD